MDKKVSEYKRTTIWLPKKLCVEVKVYALLTDSTFSEFLRHALLNEIKRLKENPVRNEEKPSQKF